MRILIAGDFCPQYRVAQLIDSGHFEPVLGQLREYTSRADYSIVNCECPILRGGEGPIVKQGPNLGCSPQGIEAIKWAGFNCVTIANNHFYDFGDGGVRSTLETCFAKGIDTVGGGMNLKEASNILYKKIGDKTLAIINCCEHEFSIASNTHGGSNPLNPIQQHYSIKKAKEKADYVLVIVHGGYEHWPLPSPRMVETYHFFIDSGADAVVNHHQHCFSGYEVYNGKPIFYGLGNLCFDRKGNWGAKWHEGLIVILSFEEGTVCHEIYPYHQCLEQPAVEFLETDAFNAKLTELNTIILDDKLLVNETDRYFASFNDKMSEVFEPFDGRYYLAAKRRRLLPSLISKKRILLAENLISCESHRDKMIHFLEHYKYRRK